MRDLAAWDLYASNRAITSVGVYATFLISLCSAKLSVLHATGLHLEVYRADPRTGKMVGWAGDEWAT